MKIIFSFMLFFSTQFIFSQSTVPFFLKGTWKMENQEIYEHWDSINSSLLRGFSYQVVDGQIKISEYLEIAKNKKHITYTATVVGKNNGNGIVFILSNTDSIYSFENSLHDFPKKIVYHPLSENKLRVILSDNKQQNFTYTLNKIPEKQVQSEISGQNPNYDLELAKKLNADDYGMKNYVLVILKTGTNNSTDKDFIKKAFRGHLENINRLVEDDKLIVAGPFEKNEFQYRGIFIFDINSIEEAEKLLESDPAVKEGLLSANLFKWYGSAALSEYIKVSDKIWKLKP